MIRKNLIQWQWSDYQQKHQSKINLLIHILAVPLFWVGLILFVMSIDGRSPFYFSLIAILISFVLQAIGHKLEQETPTAFNGFSDFLSRFLVEQFVNFPKFVFEGFYFKILFK